MAFIVIAGQSDCPLYAVTEAVADHMAAILPHFRVHKIVKDKYEWPIWLQTTCQKNGWFHYRSPIVWRELIQRGGRGILIGGASDFVQYASAYYGVTVKLTTLECLKLAADNQQLFAKQHRLTMFGVIDPPVPLFRVCLTNACQPTAILMAGEVIIRRALGKDRPISLTLVCHPDHSEVLSSIRDDLWDMGSPILREVNIALDFESAVKDCSLVIWLEDAPRGPPTAWPSQTPTWKVSGGLTSETDTLQGEAKNERPEMGTRTTKKDEEVEETTEYTNGTDASEFQSHSDASGSDVDESGKEDTDTEVETPVTRRSGPMTQSELLVERNYERFLERQQGNWDPELPKSRTATVAISSDWNVQELADETTTRPPRTRTGPSVLLEQALRIRVQGNVLRTVAKEDCKVLMMGTGNLNYNAFILSLTAKLPSGNIIAVDDAENRAKAVLASKMGLKPPEILNISIWGDPTGSFQVDASRAMTDCFSGAIWKESGFRRDFATMFHDWKWFRRELKDEMTTSRDRQYLLKGAYPVILPICHRAVTVLTKWFSPEVDLSQTYSIGVISDGLYDTPSGCVVTCPVYLGREAWFPISNLNLPSSMAAKIQRSIQKCTHTQVLYKLRFLQEDAQFELDASSHEASSDLEVGKERRRPSQSGTSSEEDFFQ